MGVPRKNLSFVLPSGVMFISDPVYTQHSGNLEVDSHSRWTCSQRIKHAELLKP